MRGELLFIMLSTSLNGGLWSTESTPLCATKKKLEKNLPCRGHVTGTIMNTKEPHHPPPLSGNRFYNTTSGFGPLTMKPNGDQEKKNLNLPWGIKEVEVFPKFTGNLEKVLKAKKVKGRPLSCAIVGSGGILKGKKKGKQIDRHNIVIRFNRAPTKGFEEDVGKRTDVRVVYPETWLRENSEFMLFVMYKPPDARWLDNVLEGRNAFSNLTEDDFFRQSSTPKGRINIARKDVAVLSPKAFLNVQIMLEEYFHNRGRRPTAGCLVIALAASMCHTTTLYGFGLGKGKDYNKVHYYDDTLVNDKYQTFIHDMKKERSFQKYMRGIGKVKIDKKANNIYKRDLGLSL